MCCGGCHIAGDLYVKHLFALLEVALMASATVVGDNTATTANASGTPAKALEFFVRVYEF